MHESKDLMQNQSHAKRFWGKADRKDPGRVHLLEHHLADVGACFEALLEQPTIRRRLARTGGLNDLDPINEARLSVVAALHDIGKVNLGFQTRVRGASHTLDMVPVVTGEDYETARAFFDALGWWWDATETWDDRGGETVCGLMVATLSHHGRPLQLEGGRAKRPRFWQGTAELDPQQYVARIGRLVRQWFPDAFKPGGPSLPSAPAFQHHFLGLCNLADWIGSNEEWFEYVDEPRDDYIDTARERAERAIAAVGLNIDAQRKKVVRAGVPVFADLFDVAGDVRAIQQVAHDAPIGAPLVIIESETGSGKTEAALWRFAEMYAAGLVDGMYFALPTRAAAAQIHGRVERFVTRLFPEGHRPPVVLAVPGYDPDADAASIAIPDYDTHAAGHHDDDDKPWASEHPKRYLASQIAVGTVDQALLGALKVKNAHLRTACLARNLLVVDEVHASDAYMTQILAALLEAHGQAGGYALLMSATLGSVARQRWLGDADAMSLADAIEVDYPAVRVRGDTIDAGENDRAKTVAMSSQPVMREPDVVAQLAVDSARAGAKVLVVRNTVSYAVNTWQAVAERAGLFDELGMNVATLLHHGRYAAGDRRLLDGRVEELLGKSSQRAGECVVVGTQTLEQSLDIDADLLITDLCPVDVLLQRMGRLHRHTRDDRPAGYDAPKCIVLTPPGDDLSPLLESGSGQDANGLGPHGYVYEDLRILQATLGLIAERPQWEIPAMNRLLVERATHPDTLAEIEALGDAWKEHGISVKGGAIGDWQTARNAIIRRDKSFFEDNREVLFPTDDERIRTRLGDDRVDIAFDPAPASPFDGAPIERIAMTVRWVDRSADVQDPVAATVVNDGGFEFAVGTRRFRYDRLGLRRA